MSESLQQITRLEDELKAEMAIFQSKIAKPFANQLKYLKILQFRINFLRWSSKKLDLYSAPQPRMVKQREIFYCELGQNVGSEQDGRRPVVVLQNNVGNAHAKITLIAPVTSFQKGSLRTIDDKLFLEETYSGQISLRPLRFYDIPIELEDNAKYPIHGVVNISQLRVVSKNRLAQTPVATITLDNYHKIMAAVCKNISIFEENPKISTTFDKSID